ncbi:MAG: SdpI family protein [Peptoniphilaceae bacterium]
MLSVFTFQFIVILIMPISMILIALYYRIKANKAISDVSGFRTSLSKSSKDNWKLAHRYSSRLLFIWGIILLLISFFFKRFKSLGDLGILLIVLFQILICIGISISTNKKLRKKQK